MSKKKKISVISVSKAVNSNGQLIEVVSAPVEAFRSYSKARKRFSKKIEETISYYQELGWTFYWEEPNRLDDFGDPVQVELIFGTDNKSMHMALALDVLLM